MSYEEFMRLEAVDVCSVQRLAVAECLQRGDMRGRAAATCDAILRPLAFAIANNACAAQGKPDVASLDLTDLHRENLALTLYFIASDTERYRVDYGALPSYGQCQ